LNYEQKSDVFLVVLKQQCDFFLVELRVKERSFPGRTKSSGAISLWLNYEQKNDLSLVQVKAAVRFLVVEQDC